MRPRLEGVMNAMMCWSAYDVCIVGSMFCVCICINLLADHVLFNGYSIVLRVLCDELAHWTSSAYVWAAVCLTTSYRKYAVFAFLCGTLSCCVDVDHFLMADELSLNALMNLRRRPFFHVTTFTAFSNLLIYLLFRQTQYGFLTVLAFSSWFPHQVRDANRRGFTLYPFRDTPPIPQWFYLFLITVTSPVATSLLLKGVAKSWSSPAEQIV
uniref:Transmembrane protein 267 n=1 Tax=Trichuris muris TaxID=70415 RepID=A0A5S6Q8B9_TRIMR